MAGSHLGLDKTASTRSPKIQIIAAENTELKKTSRGSHQPRRRAATGLSILLLGLAFTAGCEKIDGTVDPAGTPPQILSIAVSPDGTQLAFAWNATGRWELYLLELNGRDGPRQITAHAPSGPGKNFIRVLVGDRVRLELSPRDVTRGRIVEKL